MSGVPTALTSTLYIASHFCLTKAENVLLKYTHKQHVFTVQFSDKSLAHRTSKTGADLLLVLIQQCRRLSTQPPTRILLG
jgi:hypothetical protein